MVATIRDFTALPGSELSGVSFVRDYVELHFDGPVIRALAPPTIDTAGRQLTFPEPGSRDALCDFIGEVVTQARVEDEELRLTLGSAGSIAIPRASESAGPEVAHFVPTVDGQIQVAAMQIWENLRPSMLQ